MIHYIFHMRIRVQSWRFGNRRFQFSRSSPSVLSLPMNVLFQRVLPLAAVDSEYCQLCTCTHTWCASYDSNPINTSDVEYVTRSIAAYSKLCLYPVRLKTCSRFVVLCTLRVLGRFNSELSAFARTIHKKQLDSSNRFGLGCYRLIE